MRSKLLLFSLNAPLIVAATMLLGLAGCQRSLSSTELLERGILLAQREHFGESLDYFNRALALEPGNPDIYYERAVVYEQMDKTDLALGDYAEAIRLDPEFELAYNNRGIMLAGGGRYQAAIEDFSSIIQLSPGYVNAYEMRAQAFHEIGQIEKALADVNQAITLVDSAPSRSLRGTLLTSLERTDEAIADFDHVLGAEPENARAWLGRAIAQSQRGDFTQARGALQRAAELDTGILTDDILVVLSDLDAASPPQAFDMDKALDLLSDLGWETSASDSEMFPYAIRQGDDTESRCLFVTGFDPDHQGITLTGDQYVEILQEERPKSLLVAMPSDNADGSWQFIKEWSPTRENMKSVTVRLAIQDQEGQTLVHEPRDAKRLVAK